MKKIWQFGFCIAICVLCPHALSEVDVFEPEAQLRTWAQLGDSQAQNLLGHWYSDERLGQVNYDEAIYWLEQAAEQDHLGAMAHLGLMYLTGRGLPLDEGAALIYIRRAAEDGHAAAQTLLGYMYSQGIGVEQSYGEAFEWYSQAAEGGNASAQFRLALMLQNGRGVQNDTKLANYWFAEAMRQGHAGAQFQFGMNQLYGRGVAPNGLAGYQLILRASLKVGFEDRTSADLIDDALTRETIEDLNAFTRNS